jgi:hypothetical protein
MTAMLFVANDAADGAAAGQDGAAHRAGADRGTPPKPNSTVTAAAFTTNLCIVFIWNTSVLNIQCQRNSYPAAYLP